MEEEYAMSQSPGFFGYYPYLGLRLLLGLMGLLGVCLLCTLSWLCFAQREYDYSLCALVIALVWGVPLLLFGMTGRTPWYGSTCSWWTGSRQRYRFTLRSAGSEAGGVREKYMNGEVQAFAVLAVMWGLFVTVFWMVIGWRAMRAHEIIAGSIQAGGPLPGQRRPEGVN